MDRMLAGLVAVGPDPLERALNEVDAAILLVLVGVAVTVRLVALVAAEEAAATAAARAQAAGVGFRIDHGRSELPVLIIGPRLRPIAVEPER